MSKYKVAMEKIAILILKLSDLEFSLKESEQQLRT